MLNSFLVSELVGVSATYPCNPEAAVWMDPYEQTCSSYLLNKLCTPDGEVGSDFAPREFVDYADADLFHAGHCPECGCTDDTASCSLQLQQMKDLRQRRICAIRIINGGK